MNQISDNKRQQAVNDRRTFIINELYGMGVFYTRDGRKVENCRLFTLEQVYINEKHRMAQIKEQQGEIMFIKSSI
ncbi:hypothetical protein CAI16_19535 [Virgibacillus dokdonensis]|uniref:Fur-regulated basic protein FbpA n=1 Tax=Virgibacillus dokdonensis TaxID=302167 RepID=A0A3E0WIF8_9BACI|nr:hypothetical protein [Virgibacillus dokdonensis]RFA31907.1 hypothetical protein CAI16_19535 [Virgibacillus dokdonensis]